MRGLGTDCVIAEPMRGLKNASNGANRKTDTQTEGHGDSDSMTESADSVEITALIFIVKKAAE